MKSNKATGDKPSLDSRVNSSFRIPCTLEIQTVSSPVGAGKTYSAIRYAAKAARRGQKILFCQPSKHLIDKTLADFQAHAPDVTATSIYGIDQYTPCVPEIVKHFKNADSMVGEVLFITHQAFLRLGYIHNKSVWHLIHDEIPQADYSQKFNLADHREEFFSLFTEAAYNSTYAQLVGENADILDDVTTNKNEDQFWDDLSEFTARLRSDHHIVLADSENLTNFRNSKQNSVTCFALMEPTLFEGFSSVTVMGACLNESVMYRYWQDKVRFVPHEHIKPRFDKHQNGNLVTIYYAHEIPWSKKMRNKEIEIDTNKFKTIDFDIERVNQLFSGEVSVYMANKDITDIAPRIANSIQLPNSPHGLNDFQGCHNVAVFSALNPSTSHFTFLSDVAGLNPAEVGDAIARQNTYQAAGRISIRDLQNTSEKRIVVMDKTTAEWLENMLPGAKITALPGLDVLPTEKKQGGQKRIHASDADKNSAYKREKKYELLNQNKELNQVGDRETIGVYNRAIVSRSLPVKTQFFADIYSRLPMHEADNSQEDFVEFLKASSQNTYAKKESNLLLSPAVFDPNLPSDNKRGLDNVTHLRNIWLDNDGDKKFGNGISPADFASCFPNLKMYIFNSYGNNATKQKYRIMIPTKQRMTKDVYRFIIAEIMHKLANNRGYRNKKFFEKAEKENRKHPYKFDGFDGSKFTPSSLFYLPAQAGAGAAYSYFTEFNTNGSEMDVEQWIDRTVQDIRPNPEPAPKPVPTPVVTANGSAANASAALQRLQAMLAAQSAQNAQTRKQRAQDMAVAEWQSAGSGNGNAAFFKLGADLHRAGFDRGEVRSVLASEVSNAATGSQGDRKMQINGILKTLFGR